jgi:hypothetical protein
MLAIPLRKQSGNLSILLLLGLKIIEIAVKIKEIGYIFQEIAIKI